MSGDFEFEDNATAEKLSDLGRKFKALSNTRSKALGKDALVKLLKQARAALEAAAQSNDKECKASKPIAAALLEKPLVDHNDKDVKGLVAACLTHVLRLHVSECPYDAAQQKTIFSLFIWVFRKLEDPTATSAELYQSILHVINQTKCCLLILDLEEHNLLADTFAVLFGCVNITNAQAIKNTVLEVMAPLIEEGDEVTPQLLNAIVGGLLCEDQEASGLAGKLVRRQEVQLGGPLQRHLLALVAGDVDSDAVDTGPALLQKVQGACPRVVLPAAAALVKQLRAPSEDARIAALALAAGLLSTPGGDPIEKHYPQLFAAFLSRADDVKPLVRAAFVNECGELLKACSSGDTRQQVVGAVVGKLEELSEE
eukprot:CAMPEP_0206148252 /NCGR_PEP_ID=MMETSP1473-20131121/36042_1 /ASSEMBLY_ACC=CAM_ASM_001109 /TAXON_ID=1461547 /ORGANISM="Stichococcus sp, Strain RCC1054" /LENGTH=368 /DNA_ID=CAMNT_0053545515 /DNA_START=234 /DNA_END=1337 /DNA_ORIENTATION=-